MLERRTYIDDQADRFEVLLTEDRPARSDAELMRIVFHRWKDGIVSCARSEQAAAAMREGATRTTVSASVRSDAAPLRGAVDPLTLNYRAWPGPVRHGTQRVRSQKTGEDAKEEAVYVAWRGTLSRSKEPQTIQECAHCRDRRVRGEVQGHYKDRHRPIATCKAERAAGDCGEGLALVMRGRWEEEEEECVLDSTKRARRLNRPGLIAKRCSARESSAPGGEGGAASSHRARHNTSGSLP
ncbi:hypothetical protein HPB50_019803 [Hyalomma asiaticum]|uniref:Uncharacterized protein n=1 Tax=Hyalomma asiaticum TaxID=266040 RepID=A0ACB7SJ40_HYAAI|nr:hypothetical protein HPB50_019803 [Hyalomma asiaticum]